MKQLLSLALILASVLACAQQKEDPENLVGVKEVVAQIDSAVTTLPGVGPVRIMAAWHSGYNNMFPLQKCL